MCTSNFNSQNTVWLKLLQVWELVGSICPTFLQGPPILKDLLDVTEEQMEIRAEEIN